MGDAEKADERSRTLAAVWSAPAFGRFSSASLEKPHPPDLVPCSARKKKIGRIPLALPRLGLLSHGLELAGEDGLQEPEFCFLVFCRNFKIREAFSFLSVVPFAFRIREGNDLAGGAVFLGLHFVLLVFRPLCW